MSTELMVGAKGLFIAAIISIALVLISLAALILLRLGIVLTVGFWLSLGFLQLEFSIVLSVVVFEAMYELFQSGTHSGMVSNMSASSRQWPWGPGSKGRYLLSWYSCVLKS
jgi:hypothetical protein